MKLGKYIKNNNLIKYIQLKSWTNSNDLVIVRKSLNDKWNFGMAGRGGEN